MNYPIELNLKYDFDPVVGYKIKTINLLDNILMVHNDVIHNKVKITLDLYEEDIRNLLEGTGIEINGNK